MSLGKKEGVQSSFLMLSFFILFSLGRKKLSLELMHSSCSWIIVALAPLLRSCVFNSVRIREDPTMILGGDGAGSGSRGRHDDEDRPVRLGGQGQGSWQ